jgi:fructosamine-3-kinase
MGGITPSFVYGDLWEGNIGKEMSTGKHFIFDSNGYHGHHEVELVYWKILHHNIRSRDYCTGYSKQMRPSEPTAEVDDRIKLTVSKPT